MITQDDDMVFGMDGSSMLVLFNDKDTHAGDGQTVLFSEVAMF